jgi:hypothetical protein
MSQLLSPRGGAVSLLLCAGGYAASGSSTPGAAWLADEPRRHSRAVARRVTAQARRDVAPPLPPTPPWFDSLCVLGQGGIIRETRECVMLNTLT